jgi:hypothetical protein
MRTSALLLALLLVALGAPAARSDGKIVPSIGYAPVLIPDQRALIHWADGVERLAIDTSFVGQGTNFAWVVPLPSAPIIEPASSGLFPTLQVLFQPRVVLTVAPYWLVLPALALGLALLYILERRWYLWLALALVGWFFVVLPMLLPAKSKAGAAGKPGIGVSGVHVLSRQRVGVFDTATIDSSEPSALLRWLNEQGFAAPTNIAPVVAEYVKEGWVFVAARLHQESSDDQPRAVHPLVFTFKTPRPVYPLRLTGIDNRACRIDLYVFGPGGARVPGFAAERCGAPIYNLVLQWPQLVGGKLRIRHPELARLVSGAPVATKLSALLEPGDMTRDGYVSWERFWPRGERVYTPGAALTLSLNFACVSFAAAWILVSLIAWRSAWAGTVVDRWMLRVALGSLALGAVVYTETPRVPAVLLGTGSARIRNDFHELALALQDELGDTNVFPATPTSQRSLTPAEGERLLATIALDNRRIWARYPVSPLTNHFTGERIRFEASPGNVVLRPAGSTYELVWHDIDGAEALTNAVEPDR